MACGMMEAPERGCFWHHLPHSPNGGRESWRVAERDSPRVEGSTGWLRPIPARYLPRTGDTPQSTPPVREEGQVWISTGSHRPLLLSNARPGAPRFSGEGGRGTERPLPARESRRRADSRVVTVPPRGCRDPQLQFVCVWGLKEPQLSSLP